MRQLAIGIAMAALAQAASAYDGRDIANESDGRNWLSYGRTYSEQHYSPLKQVTSETIERLGLAWSLDLPNVHNGLTVPLAVDGVVYFTVDQSWVHAVDVRTGKLLWRFDPEVYKVGGRKLPFSWGPRGLAYWQDRIFVATLDGRLIALDSHSGKPLWSEQTIPTDDASNITGAPRVFNGKVIIGQGGADYGPIRGYVTAYDAKTGKQAWRFHVVPGDPAKGFENKAMAMAAKTWTGEWWKKGGGGTVWNAITYDAELNQVYLGTGNGQPHEWKERSPGGGDNLFLSSIVALNADTGAYVWHYQVDPRNSWDYNADMDITTATLQIEGKSRQVLLQAPKNGFVYVIDRVTGKLISAEKIDYATWAERIDLKTGAPVENPEVRAGKSELVPSAVGAHSVHAQAFSPQTGLLYIPTIRTGAGTANGERAADLPDRNSSRLQAWDPVARREVWSVKTQGTANGGLMATAGNLVFEGMGDGTFNAFNARTGQRVWTFDAHFGIAGAPISYEVDGKQYVSVVAGWGGAGAGVGGASSAKYGWRYGQQVHRLLTFMLDGNTALPAQAPPSLAMPIDDAQFVIDPKRSRAGAALALREMCVGCHGAVMIASSYAPDLRASGIPLSADAFRDVVKNGSLLARGMPAYGHLTDDELTSLRHFIRQRARDTIPRN